MGRPQGPRTRGDRYAPDGVTQGAVITVDADGLYKWIAYPTGASRGSHVFVTGDDGEPVWMAAEDFLATVTSAPAGFAWMWLVGIDSSGNAIIITDGAGTPIKALVPVP
jgi:hypothetical protein